MKRSTALYGVLVGATAMYLFDPDRGRARRAIVRDKAASGVCRLEDALDVAFRDLRNRTTGLLAELRSWLRTGPVPDDVLVDRIRSHIGRVVSHPRAIEVTARDGNVTLLGPVLAAEHKNLYRCVALVPGVNRVEDQLEVHETAENVPALQGGAPRSGVRPDIFQENWAPATRLMVSTLGGSLAVNALRHKTPVNAVLGLIGSTLFLRALNPKPAKRMPALAPSQDTDILSYQKTLEIAAPVDEVFEFWAHYENFPQFMSNVRSIQMKEGGSSHWVVAGPAGVPVEWDAVTTHVEPNREIGWKTVPGSIVEHSGVVRFEPTAEGTRIDVKLSYSPPAGVLGDAVAKLFGADPKSEMDTDLMRLKTLLESRKLPPETAPERQEALH